MGHCESETYSFYVILEIKVNVKLSAQGNKTRRWRRTTNKHDENVELCDEVDLNSLNIIHQKNEMKVKVKSFNCYTHSYG